MTSPLILKRAKLSRPDGQWSDHEFDVLADGKVVCASMSKAESASRPSFVGSGRS